MTISSREGKSAQTASQPIPHEMELKFWASAVSENDHPKKLVISLIYYLGKHFTIRGGSELHKLEHNKDVILSQSEGEGELSIFTENRSSKQGMED